MEHLDEAVASRPGQRCSSTPPGHARGRGLSPPPPTSTRGTEVEVSAEHDRVGEEVESGPRSRTGIEHHACRRAVCPCSDCERQVVDEVLRELSPPRLDLSLPSSATHWDGRFVRQMDVGPGHCDGVVLVPQAPMGKEVWSVPAARWIHRRRRQQEHDQGRGPVVAFPL